MAMPRKINVNQLTVFRVAWLLCLSVVFAGCGGGGLGGIGTDTCAEDSAIQNFAVAYVKRPAPTDNNGIQQSRDYRDVINFSPGAVLYIKLQATVCADAIDVTSREIGNTGDVKGVEISPDGTKVLFAMKEEDDNTDMDEETWNIWEYEIVTDTLTRVITSPLIAEAGNDIDPHYLADGRIIFSSDRQLRNVTVLQKEAFTNGVNKPGTPKAVGDDSDELSFNLHVMDSAGGANRRQVTFNEGHDLEPSLMDDGRILFTRWETVGGNEFNLYTMNPDGSNTQLLYGRNSHQTGSQNDTIHFTQPREREDGSVSAIIRPFDNTFDGGDIVIIDVASYVDIATPIAATPTLTGPAQVSVSNKAVRTAAGISTGGRYGSAYPYRDGSGRLLVSWSACAVDINGQLVATGQLYTCSGGNLADPTATEVAPRYGLFILDPANNSFTPLVFPEAPIPNPAIPDTFIYYYYTDAVAAQDRTNAINIVDATDETAAEQTGVIHIKSVYDFGNPSTWGFLQGADATASIDDIRDPDTAPLYANHPARFIRIVKQVLLPSTDDLDIDPDAFGESSANGMREIVGYVPVEPDGSAKFKVPADVPIALSVLDEKGRRISERHNFWMTVRNGETIECIGCHSRTDNTLRNVHGRLDAEPVSRNPGAPLAGTSFLNTQATFDLNILAGGTMAEARNPDYNNTTKPTLDIVFTDVWSAGVTAPLPDINLLYDDVYNFADVVELKPVTNNCKNDWQDPCRIIINYAEHIAPLWSRDRAANTCINCHTDNNGVPVEPAGQLVLDPTAVSSNPNLVESYLELFNQDQAVELDGGGNLVPKQAVDGGGNPLFIDNITGLVTTSPVDANMMNNAILVADAPTPVMSVNGARQSYFIEKMTGETDLGAGGTSLNDGTHLAPGDVGYVDHTTFMTDAELKVIAEWLDIGAQYFNNPFATGVPTE